jgi:hypothetical protein
MYFSCSPPGQCGKKRNNRIFNVVAKSEATFLELTVEEHTNWRLAGLKATK